MSDYLLNDVPWDDEEAIVDREPESGSGRHHFGFLRLYPLSVTKSFEAGNSLTIPNVTGGQYNEKDKDGLMEFKGWKAGGKQYLFVLVAIKQDKDGNDYQIVKQLPSKLGQKGDPHVWADFTLPSLKNLSIAERKKMTSEGVYCEWDEVETGHKATIQGDEKEIKAWVSFQPHPDQASLRKAENEFFSKFSNGKGDADIYPADWVKSNSVDDMLNHGKALEFSDHADLATQLMLIDKSGLTAKTTGGNDVNVVQIIASILDIPEPMVKL